MDKIDRKWRNIFLRSVIACTFAIAFLCYANYTNLGVQAGCSNEDLLFQNVLPAQATTTTSPDSDKVVYLTFDDGPSPTTELILDILKEQDVKATFFVIAAPNNEEYLPLLNRTVSEGHAVGLHSCTHAYKDIYSSTSAFWADLENLRLALAPYGCGSTMLLRFPGGSSNTVSRKYGGSEIMATLMQEATEKGYTYFDWNVDCADAIGGKQSADEIYSRIVRQSDGLNNCIVLMHDSVATKTTASALPQVISWYKNAGYRFDTLNNAIMDET